MSTHREILTASLDLSGINRTNDIGASDSNDGNSNREDHTRLE